MKPGILYASTDGTTLPIIDVIQHVIERPMSYNLSMTKS